MVKAKKAKLHNNIPLEWKRWLVRTKKREDCTEEELILRGLQLLRDLLEVNNPPKLPVRVA